MDLLTDMNCLRKQKQQDSQNYIWRKWQRTPVLLPGKSQGQRSLVGYSPWGCKESDTTEHTCTISLWVMVQDVQLEKRFFFQAEESFACGQEAIFTLPSQQVGAGLDCVSFPLHPTSFLSSMSYFSPSFPLLPPLTFVCFRGIFSFLGVSFSVQKERNKI